MKASKFTDAQKAFVIKQSDELGAQVLFFAARKSFWERMPHRYPVTFIVLKWHLEDT